MHTLRSPEGQKVYDEYLATMPKDVCILCEKAALPGKQFNHWKIVVNDFPYDQIATRHDMIVPLRHITERELSAEELQELMGLKETDFDEAYDFLMEAVPHGKSIPGHFHLHLIVANQ